MCRAVARDAGIGAGVRGGDTRPAGQCRTGQRRTHSKSKNHQGGFRFF
jgi:hypothetical protein